MRFFARSLIAACLLAGFALVQASPVFAQTPPSFTKAFSPASVALGETSRLIFTINNFNAIAVTGLAFTDRFPFGLSGRGNVNNGCRGRVSASLGGDTVSDGGAVAAGGTCTIS